MPTGRRPTPTTRVPGDGARDVALLVRRRFDVDLDEADVRIEKPVAVGVAD
jgi:hypothetical protein